MKFYVNFVFEKKTRAKESQLWLERERLAQMEWKAKKEKELRAELIRKLNQKVKLIKKLGRALFLCSFILKFRLNQEFKKKRQQQRLLPLLLGPNQVGSTT
jgi:hypothetical protein